MGVDEEDDELVDELLDELVDDFVGDFPPARWRFATAAASVASDDPPPPHAVKVALADTSSIVNAKNRIFKT